MFENADAYDVEEFHRGIRLAIDEYERERTPILAILNSAAEMRKRIALEHRFLYDRSAYLTGAIDALHQVID